MSLGWACWWTLVRTCVLCLCAWPICIGVERWLRQVSDRWRPLAFGLVLAPFLFPELLVGYTYRGPALSSSRAAEWLCTGLLLLRIVPIGVVTLLASPPGLASASALYCRWMLVRQSGFSLRELARLLACIWNDPVRRVLPALGLMALVAFQEFELAALLQTASWTDWFIAAQRVGLDRNAMLAQSSWPVVMQLPLVLGIVNWAVHRQTPHVEANHEFRVSARNHGMALLYLAVALTGGCLIPLIFLGSNLLSGLRLILVQRTQLLGLSHEVVIAVAISLTAGLATWGMSGRFLRSQQGSRFVRIGVQGVLLPGLAGSLLLSLAVSRLFQQPWFRPFYDTPIPWVIAVTVWLFPRAVLVRLWLEATQSGEGLYLASLLTNGAGRTSASMESPAAAQAEMPHPTRLAGSLAFRLRDQPRLLAIGLLCYWAYLDLSTAYLLAPTGMPSGLVRLYNFMHFGRSAALSAEAFAFFGMPIALLCLAIGIMRLFRS
ncbi:MULTISPECIES: hypothetical protein [unclassified Schlesneria]|uniref:hypothetical protein n=1 Tax=unclassified Schlesneria TaxID=2762017 RepID=UPI002EFCC4B8